MAVWTFVNDAGNGVAWDEEGQQVSAWDDGETLPLHDPRFSRRKADVVAEGLTQSHGRPVTACYGGTPNWSPPTPIHLAEAEAEAEDRVRMAEDLPAITKAVAKAAKG